MATYTFPAFPAIDPKTGRLLTNTSGVVYAVTDTAFANPLPITDLSGVTIDGGRLQVGPQSLTAEFQTDQPEVVWRSGEYVLHLWSPKSLVDAAQQAADTVRELAEAQAAQILGLQGRADGFDEDIAALQAGGVGGGSTPTPTPTPTGLPFKLVADYGSAGSLKSLQPLPANRDPAVVASVLTNNNAILLACLKDRPELWSVGPEWPVPTSLQLTPAIVSRLRLRAWLQHVAGDATNGRDALTALTYSAPGSAAQPLASVGYASLGGADNPNASVFQQTCSALALPVPSSPAAGQTQGNLRRYFGGQVLQVASKDPFGWASQAIDNLTTNVNVWRAEEIECAGVLVNVTAVNLAPVGNPATLERHLIKGASSNSQGLINGWQLKADTAQAHAMMAAVTGDFVNGEDLIDVKTGAVFGKAGTMVVALNGWLDYTYTTSPVVRIMDTAEVELDLRITGDRDPDSFIGPDDRGLSIMVAGVAHAQVKVRGDKINSRMVIAKSCWQGTWDIVANGIANHALPYTRNGVTDPFAEGAYGYGLEVRGTSRGLDCTVHASYVRHGLTSNPNAKTWEAAADSHLDYGCGGTDVLVHDSVVLNPVAAGMDTHEGCLRFMFRDILVANSFGGGRTLTNGVGFNNRGFGTSYVSCTARGMYHGFTDAGATLNAGFAHSITYTDTVAQDYERRGYFFNAFASGVAQDGTALGVYARVILNNAVAIGDGRDPIGSTTSSPTGKSPYQAGFEFSFGVYEVNGMTSRRFNGVPFWLKGANSRHTWTGAKADYSEGYGTSGMRIDASMVWAHKGRYHCHSAAAGTPASVFRNAGGDTTWYVPDGVFHTSEADTATARATPPAESVTNAGNPTWVTSSSSSGGGSGGGTVDPGLTPATHETALNIARAALTECELRPVHITCLGDSITWGVGSDGLSSEVYPYDPAGQQASYREGAWPSIVGKLLTGHYGGEKTPRGFAGPAFPTNVNGGGWQYATASGTVTQSTTAGAFGAHANAQRGGVAIGQASGVPGAVEWDASKLGAFTELLVEFYGTDAGVASPVEPTVTIDGVVVYTPTSDTPTGVLNRLRFTGLSDAPHTVKVSNPLVSGRTVYCPGIIATRSTGIVVNRVASPGATSNDAAAPNYTAQQRQRVIEAATKPGLTDLLIIALGTNDYGGQVALATYTANLTALAQPVLDAGGTVLLLGGPTPRNGGTGAIPEADYDSAAAALAQATTRMAFVSLRTLLQASTARTYADGAGLFVASTTVHPSRRGHAYYARAVASLLTRALTSGTATTDALPVPTAPKVTPAGVTSTTATLQWPTVVAAQRYTVEYQLTSATTSWTTAGDTDGLSYTVTGLTAGAAYRFRVTAKGSAGTGGVSHTVTRTTSAA